MARDLDSINTLWPFLDSFNQSGLQYGDVRSCTAPQDRFDVALIVWQTCASQHTGMDLTQGDTWSHILPESVYSSQVQTAPSRWQKEAGECSKHALQGKVRLKYTDCALQQLKSTTTQSLHILSQLRHPHSQTHTNTHTPVQKLGVKDEDENIHTLDLTHTVYINNVLHNDQGEFYNYNPRPRGHFKQSCIKRQLACNGFSQLWCAMCNACGNNLTTPFKQQ